MEKVANLESVALGDICGDTEIQFSLVKNSKKVVLMHLGVTLCGHLHPGGPLFIISGR